MQIYTSIDDIWCEWGKAITAIIEYLEEKESLSDKHEWHFNKGYVVNQHDAYCVYTTFSTYHPILKSIVEIHVSATVELADNKITVKDTGKRLVKNTITS
ncbi:hypothetical protein MTZ49_07340 [Entomomonas sp. E2T0]|uniref:hypothetical protein n=1 Tax=Entomomonas sp. E2T0 TaxID=2930213 RepID=UPI002228217D|nr:hypothetical protein [Entomomonas sp. E2T0]UYZ85352.1 hypothetical protein MTZ49_07340 [Entomomonas sp. E2T0]